MAGVIDQGLCLRTWDWSETSQTALLLCRETGLIRVVAKGSRREKAPFSGGLEALTAGEASVFPRQTGGLSTLGSWQLEERFDGARRSVAGFLASMYIADVVSHAVTEQDPHPGLFDAAVVGLRELGAVERGTERVVGAVLLVQWAALDESGHRPELWSEVTSGRAAPDEDVLSFSPALGGLAGQVRGVPGEIWRVRRGTIEFLRRLGEGAATDAGAEPITPVRGARFLQTYLRYVLGAELASFTPLLAEVERTGAGGPETRGSEGGG